MSLAPAARRQLQPSATLAAEGAAQIPSVIPTTRFCRQQGVRSEIEYKLRCRDQGAIMYHLQVGLSTWPETRDALVQITETLDADGFRVDRFGLCLDRGMSVPEADRAGAAKETGPRLAGEQWKELGEAAAIQPHLGDFMIGTPAGFENTLHALHAGITTIGNLGQYFAFDTPGVDDVTITEETVKALGAMAAARPAGALVHSYLDDGKAMQLSHYGSYVGWAALELYVVQELLGARLAHSFGGLVPNPYARAVISVALDDLRDGDSVGSMVYGNTVDYTDDYVHNAAVLATYFLVDIATQIHRPTGHGLNPVPLSEAQRIPTAQEIIEVQRIGHELEHEARRSGDLFDWNKIDRLAADVADYGQRFATRALELLSDDGVDIGDAGQVLLALRRADPVRLEERAALHAPPEIARLEPWKASQLRTFVSRIAGRTPDLRGTRVILAVLEVHDLVRDALARALASRGCEVVLLPTNARVEDVARVASDEDAAAVVVGTYNGGALSLGRALRAGLDSEGFDGPVFFGGVLNQDVEGSVPRDVHADLEQLGIVAVDRAEDLGPLLAKVAQNRLDVAQARG